MATLAAVVACPLPERPLPVEPTGPDHRPHDVPAAGFRFDAARLRAESRMRSRWPPFGQRGSWLFLSAVGVPDPRWGERPTACVVLRPDEEPTAHTKVDLITFLEPRVPKWWLPDEIVFLDHIPKTSVGKFSKKDLRHLLASSHGESR